MIDPSVVLLFLAGALILNITPGPDMAFTLAISAKGGIRAGVAAAFGIGAGSLAWAVMAAAGLAALLAASSESMNLIRIMGGLYLIYLALRAFRGRHNDIAATAGSGRVPAALRSGFITNLFNPKVGLFYVAFLPTFTNSEAGPIYLQILLLGALFSLSGVVILTAVAITAGSLRDRYVSSRGFAANLHIAAAAMFGGLGLYLLSTSNR